MNPVLRMPNNVRVPAEARPTLSHRHQPVTATPHASLPGRAFRGNASTRGPPAPAYYHGALRAPDQQGHRRRKSRLIYPKQISFPSCVTK